MTAHSTAGRLQTSRSWIGYFDARKSGKIKNQNHKYKKIIENAAVKNASPFTTSNPLDTFVMNNGGNNGGGGDGGGRRGGRRRGGRGGGGGGGGGGNQQGMPDRFFFSFLLKIAAFRGRGSGVMAMLSGSVGQPGFLGCAWLANAARKWPQRRWCLVCTAFFTPFRHIHATRAQKKK